MKFHVQRARRHLWVLAILVGCPWQRPEPPARDQDQACTTSADCDEVCIAQDRCTTGATSPGPPDAARMCGRSDYAADQCRKCIILDDGGARHGLCLR